MALTEDEIELRRPVWLALSDLFLDTDVSHSYEYIIRVCSESNFSTEELKEILVNEIAPVVSVNLLDVAGEWAGFDEKWLVRNICRNVKKGSTISGFILKRFRTFCFTSYIEEHWEKIAPKINEAKENGY